MGVSCDPDCGLCEDDRRAEVAKAETVNDKHCSCYTHHCPGCRCYEPWPHYRFPGDTWNRTWSQLPSTYVWTYSA
jgi:hypothetical protein